MATGELPPEDLPMPELLAAVSFEASDPLQRCVSFQDRGLARRQPRDPESLLMTPAQHVRPLAHLRPAFAAAGNLLVHVTGTRELTRVPEET